MVRSPFAVLGLLGLIGASPLGAGNCPSLCGKSPASAPGARGLLVSGVIQEGTGTLAPAYPTPRLTNHPEQGAYSLLFLDAKGSLLNKIYFNLPAQARETSLEAKGTPFSLVVPYTAAMRDGLVAMELFKGKDRLAVLQASHQQASVAPVRHAPVARTIAPGVVRLEWDHATHPGVLVKDANSGETLAVGEGGTVDFKTFAWELEVTLSDGLHSLTLDVRVGAPSKAGPEGPGPWTYHSLASPSLRGRGAPWEAGAGAAGGPRGSGERHG